MGMGALFHARSVHKILTMEEMGETEDENSYKAFADAVQSRKKEKYREYIAQFYPGVKLLLVDLKAQRYNGLEAEMVEWELENAGRIRVKISLPEEELQQKKLRPIILVKLMNVRIASQ